MLLLLLGCFLRGCLGRFGRLLCGCFFRRGLLRCRLFCRCFFGGQLLLVCSLGLGDLLGHVILGGLQLLDLLGVHIALGGDLLDELIHLRLLRLKLGLLALLLGQRLLLPLAAGLQVGLGLGHGLPRFGQLVQDLIVGVHDLPDHVDPVQQVRKIAGLEQDGPVGHVAPLLHGPHPLLKLCLILGFLGLGLLQLGLLLRDLPGILDQQVFRDLDLLVQHIQLLLHQILLVQGLALGRANAVQLLLQLCLLHGQAGLLALQGLDGAAAGRLRTGKAPQRQSADQKQREASLMKLSGIHKTSERQLIWIFLVVQERPEPTPCASACFLNPSVLRSERPTSPSPAAVSEAGGATPERPYSAAEV